MCCPSCNFLFSLQDASWVRHISLLFFFFFFSLRGSYVPLSSATAIIIPSSAGTRIYQAGGDKVCLNMEVFSLHSAAVGQSGRTFPEKQV